MDEKQAMIASLINNLIRDEWEAIEGYNGVIATLADSEGDDIDGIISNLEDIRDEEYVHVGQLESCLSVLKGDPVEQIDDGSEEGFEKLELPEEEDEVEMETESLKEAINLPSIDNLYSVEFKSAKYGNKPPYKKGVQIPYEQIYVLAGNPSQIRRFYANNLLGKAFQFGDAPAYQKFGNLISVEKLDWGNQYQIDLLKGEDKALSDLGSGKKLASTLPPIKLVDVKLPESLKEEESGGESFDWNITDEVNREYERITKKFPNITDDELEDRLYSSIANILSGWQFVDRDKNEVIDNIINDLMNEKRRAISTEDVSTEEMKNVICSMINEYDASEEEVYDELSSANPDVSRDMVHRLYQMCSGNKEEPQQETSFEDFWNEMEETEED